MKIAIPTYNREEIKTLSLLENKFEDVYIFPNNYGDKLKEKEEELRAKYPKCNIVGLDTKGIGQARNGILDYFAGKEEEILMLDDDISGFFTLDFLGVSRVLKKMSQEETFNFFEDAFNICKKNKTKLWGIYPIKNDFYMNYKIDNKGFCIGTCLGIIINEMRFDEKASFKEDYEYTIQNIIKFKKVCRFNYVTVEAGHYTNAGGVCQQRKEDPEREGRVAKYLVAKYPKILKFNPQRENEILINL